MISESDEDPSPDVYEKCTIRKLWFYLKLSSSTDNNIRSTSDRCRIEINPSSQFLKKLFFPTISQIHFVRLEDTNSCRIKRATPRKRRNNKGVKRTRGRANQIRRLRLIAQTVAGARKTPIERSPSDCTAPHAFRFCKQRSAGKIKLPAHKGGSFQRERERESAEETKYGRKLLKTKGTGELGSVQSARGSPKYYTRKPLNTLSRYYVSRSFGGRCLVWNRVKF